MSEVASFTDYFIFCNGNSSRLLDALAETIIKSIRKEYKLHSRLEGRAEDGWMLLDMGDIIIHLFDPEERKYYSLDELWESGKVIVKFQ